MITQRYQGPYIPHGCIAKWRFDVVTAADKVIDRTGHAHSASLVGSPSLIAGGMNFDGASDYVSLGNSDDLNVTTDWTLFGFLTILPGATNGATIWERWSTDGLQVFWTSDANEIRFHDGSDYRVTGTGKWTAGALRSFAASVTSNLITCYTDGAQSGANGVTFSVPNKSGVNTYALGPYKLKCRAHLLMLFNRGLKSSEILALHQQGPYR